MTLTDLRTRYSRDNNYLFLRLLLASFVIVAHSQVAYYGRPDAELLSRLLGGLTLGDLAVNGFFIISGFLITASYLNRPHAYTYFRNRIFRICPGFILCSLLCGIAFSLLQLKQHFGPGPMPPGALLATIFSLHTKIPDVSLDSGMHWNWNVSIWTIPYELFCYMGVLLMGCTRALRPHIVLGLLVLMTLLPLGSHLAALRPLFGFIDAFVPAAPRLAQFFLAGCAAFLYADKICYTPLGLSLAWMLLAFTIALPVVGNVLQAFPATYVLLWVAYRPIAGLNGFKKFPDVSYGTYLYGWPAGLVVLYFWPGVPYFGLLTLNLLLAYAAGWCSWHAVEKWFLRLPPSVPKSVTPGA